MADYSELRQRFIDQLVEKFDRQIEERFEWRVQRAGEDECHEWIGSPDPWGYGVFYLLGKRLRAHRVAFEIAAGREIAIGMDILHSCDNPPCCNPRHLREGTALDNGGDRVARNRAARGHRHGSHTQLERRAYGERNGRTTHPEKRPRGEANGRTRLTEADVIEIRRRRKDERTPLARLAEQFSVSEPTIQAIVYRRNWAYLE